jgi:hypothetical protein
MSKETYTTANAPPGWLWRGSLIALVGVMALAAIVLGLVLCGVGDPRPAGELAVQDELDRVGGWEIRPDTVTGEVREGTYHIEVPQPNTRVFASTPYEMAVPGTLEIAARQASGPREAGYGLWWGDGDTRTVVAINGNGYFGVFQVTGGDVESIEEWQPFPHVLGRGESNRLRVDVLDGWVVVRVNDELAATFEQSTGGLPGVGLYVETFNTGGSVAAVEWLRIWQDRRTGGE